MPVIILAQIIMKFMLPIESEYFLWEFEGVHSKQNEEIFIDCGNHIAKNLGNGKDVLSFPLVTCL